MKTGLKSIIPGVSLDTHSNELIFEREGYFNIVRIEPMMTKLLNVLLNARGETITREQLIIEVWEGNEGVGNKALTKNIYKLRKVLETNGFCGLIETLPKRGYRLNRIRTKIPESKRSIKPWMIAAALIVGTIVMKVMIPGIFHFLSHRMMH